VRLRALDVALSAGVSVSRETLTTLTYDSSPPVRALALEAIASGTPVGGDREAETLQLVRRLTADPDPEVRAKAADILASRNAN
jgi:HEAT repeat protein